MSMFVFSLCFECIISYCYSKAAYYLWHGRELQGHCARNRATWTWR